MAHEDCCGMTMDGAQDMAGTHKALTTRLKGITPTCTSPAQDMR